MSCAGATTTSTRRTKSLNANCDLTNIRGQFVDAPRLRVPCEHEAGAAADERIELPSPRAQRCQLGLGHANEDGVGFDRKHDVQPRRSVDLFCETPGAGVAMLGVAPPRAGLEQADPRRG